MNSVTPTLPDELSIEFNHTADDYLAMLRDMFLNEPYRLSEILRNRRNFRKFALLMYALGAGLVYPALLLQTKNSLAFGMTILALGFLLGSASFMWKRTKTREDAINTHMAYFRTRIQKGDIRPVVGHRSVTINGAGVVIETTLFCLSLKWAAISRVVNDDKYIFFFSHFNEGWAIPKSAFTTPEDASRFFSFASNLHENSDGSVRSRLANSDEHCFACNYNLRGSDGQVCPECGVRLLLSQHPTGPVRPELMHDPRRNAPS